MRVSLSGYGKSVYVQHPNGTTTVYAHLKKLASPFEKLLKDIQYQRQSYTVQFYPKGDDWQVDTGALLGYSGNTGGSLGPHLHFEVRDRSLRIHFILLTIGRLVCIKSRRPHPK